MTKEEIKKKFGYDNVWDFREGLAPVRLDKKEFHITKEGKPAYDERYDRTYCFVNGRALVERNGEKFHINTHGKRVMEPHEFSKKLYDEKRYFLLNDRASFETDEMVPVYSSRSNNSFHIRKNLKPAYKERFDFVGAFDGELAPARIDDEKFYINKRGKKVKARL